MYLLYFFVALWLEVDINQDSLSSQYCISVLIFSRKNFARAFTLYNYFHSFDGNSLKHHCYETQNWLKAFIPDTWGKRRDIIYPLLSSSITIIILKCKTEFAHCTRKYVWLKQVLTPGHLSSSWDQYLMKQKAFKRTQYRTLYNGSTLK